MSTFHGFSLIAVAAAVATGCEQAPSAYAEAQADHPAVASSGAATSVIGEAGATPLRAILGVGDAGFVPKFIGSQIIGNSEIFQSDHRIIIGGTAPGARLQVQDDFAGKGSIVNIHQVDPTGDITLEFSQAPGTEQGVMGDIGVIRSNGLERFAILSHTRNPRNLPLTLAEDGANVGIGTTSPGAKLDVAGGNVHIRHNLIIGGTEPSARLQVQDNFSGSGTMINLHQVDPTGDITLEFSQAPGTENVMGNVGVIRTGARERFVVLGAGRNPRNLPLTLAEDGGNVGIGTANPGSTLDVNGNANVSGNLTVHGTKSSVATLSDGRRVLLYAIESPKNWFEDFGTAQLTDGETWVSLEGVFAETVNTGGDYHVFLTPNGDCRGLYVAERRPDGFLVRELGGGTSNVTFDYRIVALRRGFETVRLSGLP